MLFKEMIPFLEEHKNEIKVHCGIGTKDVFEVLYAFERGDYKEWQEHQTKKNFSRKYILSLCYYGKDEWLFVGIYESIAVKEHPTKNGFQYDTRLTDIGKEYIGRVVITFKKNFRQSYLCLEKYIDDFELLELKREVWKSPFPGYNKVNVSWNNLAEWIKTDSWRTALQNQKGVYLITDTHTGKRYVGSAYGNDMLLGRWESYIKTGHGGNVELKRLPFDYIKENFRYTILEIFKATTDDQDIIEREKYWKDVLMTRIKKYGYNDN